MNNENGKRPKNSINRSGGDGASQEGSQATAGRTDNK
jgi:hypothetical protein